jgi:hypothetical protein
MELADVVVIGDKQVIACPYVYNTGDSKVSYLALASLANKPQNIRLKN